MCNKSLCVLFLLASSHFPSSQNESILSKALLTVSLGSGGMGDGAGVGRLSVLGLFENPKSWHST